MSSLSDPRSLLRLSKDSPLPGNETWIHIWSGQKLTGQQRITAHAPLGQPPVYYRSGSRFTSTFQKLRPSSATQASAASESHQVSVAPGVSQGCIVLEEVSHQVSVAPGVSQGCFYLEEVAHQASVSPGVSQGCFYLEEVSHQVSVAPGVSQGCFYL